VVNDKWDTLIQPAKKKKKKKTHDRRGSKMVAYNMDRDGEPDEGDEAAEAQRSPKPKKSVKFSLRLLFSRFRLKFFATRVHACACKVLTSCAEQEQRAIEPEQETQQNRQDQIKKQKEG
jgi:hypothetical protein